VSFIFKCIEKQLRIAIYKCNESSINPIIHHSARGKLKIEEKVGLSIKNVEGCGENMNAEYTAAVRSVVAKEMEKCMKSIEHSLLERKK